MKTTKYRDTATGEIRDTPPTSAIIGGQLVTGPGEAAGWERVEVEEKVVADPKPKARPAYVAEAAMSEIALKYAPVESLDRNPATVIEAIRAAALVGTQAQKIAVLTDAIQLQQLFLQAQALGGGVMSPGYLQETETVFVTKRIVTPL